MNEEMERDKNLIDTTDCLEAVSVFRAWKNFLFALIILCLLLLQAAFWLVHTGYVKTCAAPPEETRQTAPAVGQIQQAAKEVTAAPNQPSEAVPAPVEQEKARFTFSIKIGHLTWLVRFVSFVLIPVSILYCLTMLFSLKVSLLGRLGGINHIARAFFLSLTFVVLLLPWQRVFGGIVAGAMYTPQELIDSCTAVAGGDIFCKVLLYLRFTGYWLLVMLLLISSQFRSGRWTRTILHRLEII